jgi:hypothetical protein
MVIAVSSDGKQFATDTQVNVEVFHRNSNGVFAKIGSDGLNPPLAGQGANSIKFAEETDATTGDNLLVIGWCGAEGESTATTVDYVTSAGALKPGWKHHQMCNSFDSVMLNGVAVSAKGEYVVVGKWGCGEGKFRPKNFFVFEGVGGKGVPVFEASTPGAIWAVDVDIATNEVDGTATVVVGAGAWSINGNEAGGDSSANVVDGAGTAAQAYVWTMKQSTRAA